MDETALISVVGKQVRPLRILLLGLLITGVFWLGVETAGADVSTVGSDQSAPTEGLAAVEGDGEVGIDDIDPDGGFGPTLGIILGVSAVVVYGYMRMRNQ